MNTSLIGTWMLDACIVEFSDNRSPLYPFGHRPNGMIMYTSQGKMQALLSHEHRTAFQHTGLEMGHRSTIPERAKAFSEYLSYGGTYIATDNYIEHKVEYALNPSIIGTTLKRYYELSSPHTLVLYYTDIKKSGLQCKYQLHWQR